MSPVESRYVCIVAVIFLAVGVASFEVKCGPGDVPLVQEEINLAVYKRDEALGIYKSFVQNISHLTSIVDRSKPTILYVHGFMETSDSGTVRAVATAYLLRGDVNVLVLDWGIVADDFNYILVSRKVPAVGKIVANFLRYVSNVIDPRTLHIVGHSLGAHVAGFIARNLNVTIPRVTGLDPAFPLFYPSECHLEPTDAEAVVVVHTDSGIFGTPVNTGTVDFYANNGVCPQPGCPLFIITSCSHQASVRLFVESINNPTAFPSSKCTSVPGENGPFNETVYFNDTTPSDIRGAYCFSTNGSPPYGTYN